MDYQILSFDATAGLVIASFGPIVTHVELPIVNGKFDASDLDNLIRNSVPADKLARLTAIANGEVGGAEEVMALIAPPPPMSQDQIEWGIRGYVKLHLDLVAQGIGYDSIDEAVGYADEPEVPKYQIEGAALRAWRSKVWVKTDQIIEAYKTGVIPQPTAQAVVETLPKFVYPAL